MTPWTTAYQASLSFTIFTIESCSDSRASLIALLVKNLSAMQETPVQFLGWEDPMDIKWIGYSTRVFLGFPCGSAGKESACNAVDLGLIPGLGRSLEEGKGYPLLCSGLENSMDCMVHRRRQWHPTPVLLPGKSHGRRSLVGCSPRGR